MTCEVLDDLESRLLVRQVHCDLSTVSQTLSTSFTMKL